MHVYLIFTFRQTDTQTDAHFASLYARARFFSIWKFIPFTTLHEFVKDNFSYLHKLFENASFLNIHDFSASGLICYCHGHCPDTSPDLSGQCFAKAGAKCFAAVEMVTDPDTNEILPERTYGCLPPEESGLMQCRGSLVPHANPANISCCSDGDFCNQDLRPMYNPLPPESDFDSGSGFKNASTLNQATSMALLVSLTACLVILIVFVAFLYLR